MPNLLNPFAYGAGTGVSGAFITLVESTLNATSYTFTSHDIGAANANRVVVVGIAVDDAGTDNQITAVTIGGSAGLMAVDTSSAGVLGRGRIAAIYYRAIAAGTTATTIVTLLNGADSCGIAVWALYPTLSTPVDAASDRGASVGSVTATDLAVTSGGTVCAVHYHTSAQGTDWTWTGAELVTELFTNVLGDSGNNWGAAMISVSTSSTTNDLRADIVSGTPNASIAAASWGP